MARPSTNTDLKLLEAGRKLLPTTGISALSVRRVAQEAGVNLGMFHYHFKTKDEFARRLLSEFYEEFFGALRVEFENEALSNDPRERVRKLLTVLGQFALQNRVLLASLLRDALAGEKLVIEFAMRNAPRHIGLLSAAIEDAQKKGVLRSDVSVLQAFLHAVSNVGVMSIVYTAASRAAPKPLDALADEILLAPNALESKIDLVLRGLEI